jgi:hypothetical protein
MIVAPNVAAEKPQLVAIECQRQFAGAQDRVFPAGNRCQQRQRSGLAEGRISFFGSIFLEEVVEASA